MRSRLPLRNARSVNSPGSASRAPAAIARPSTACSTTGLPWPVISTTCSPVYECGAGKNVATTSSSADALSTRCTRVNVACRGCSASPRSRNSPARLSARGPLSLTTPNAPRPGGVAIATMVSSVANMGGGWRSVVTTNHQLLTIFSGDDHRLHERIADALGRHGRILGDGKVDDAALVRIERAHFLRHAARPRLLGDALRHRPHFGS